MKEFVDIRVSEEWAETHLGQSWGEPMALRHSSVKVHPSLMTRRIVIETSDPKFGVLKDKMSEVPPGPMSALHFREYHASELAGARFLQLIITTFVDACGEDYGTVYDDSAACSRCGFGRKQVSPLRLDLGKIPETDGFATTIARGEELLVSESLAQVIHKGGVAGCRLDQLEHVGQRSQQGRWYQLVITTEAGETASQTRFAKDFLHEDTAQEFVCPRHQLSGLNLVSEVFLREVSIEPADILKTTNRYGNRAGWLQPSPILLISQRFYRLLKEHSIRGYRAEVARLVP